jgi:hypothetical protein
MARFVYIILCFGLLGLVGASCLSGGERLEGFGSVATGSGPQILWDLDAKPLPDIPLPNDVAMRADPSSPTGLWLNASHEAPTLFERNLRKHMSNLDGFGSFSPIWIRFDKRLDLVNIAQRQRGDNNFADDLVYLIDISPDSPDYGKTHILDFGNGNFPLALAQTDRYFPYDPRSKSSNLLLETYDEKALGDGDDHCDVWEDINQNGVLDAGEDLDQDGRLDIHEDTDHDGLCDIPNLWGSVLNEGEKVPFHEESDQFPNDPFNDLITFYELQTDTLLFRPLAPLRESNTYAVVITKNLVGTDGQSIRSPFATPHHLQQKEALKPLFTGGLLEKIGLSEDDVAFAWSYTTQSVTRDLVKIREGLNGQGVFSHLGKTYSPKVTNLVKLSDDTGLASYRMPAKDLTQAIDVIFNNIDVAGFDKSRINSLLDTYGAVDYIVAGDYTSPDFLQNAEGIFEIDASSGNGKHAPESLRFVLVVPKSAYGQAPFPTALYCHGYTSMKVEALAFAGILAKFGIATFVIDAYGHGLPLGDTFDVLVSSVLKKLEGEGLQYFFDAIKEGRARDINNDKVFDVGGDFWTNDIFHTRDLVRQTVIDYLQGVRMLKTFDGQQRFDFDMVGGQSPGMLAGDFNNDGVVDVGGPHNPYYVLGTSMGGILSSIIGALEPSIVAAAPVSPGGGLLEVAIRSTLTNVRRATVLPILGPMLIIEPHGGDDRLHIVKWLVNNVFDESIEKIATIGELNADNTVVNELRAGDIFRAENLSNGQVDEVIVGKDLTMRSHIPADRQDLFRVKIWRPDGSGEPMFSDSLVKEGATLVKEITTYEFDVGPFYETNYEKGDPLKAIQGGLGYRRNTPSLRRLLAITQTILEPGDPINWAPLYADPIHIAPEGKVPTNILYTLTLGDMTVPISTGIALGRAAGVIGYDTIDERYGITQNELLLQYHVTEGVDELEYFSDDCCRNHCGQVNFDIDDLSNGLHESNLPRLAAVGDPAQCGATPLVCTGSCEALPPLRATIQNSHGINAVRFPALKAQGQHAIDLPDPSQDFDASIFVLNQIGLYLSSGGTVLSDHPCLAKNDCSDCTPSIHGDACPAIPAGTKAP